MHKIVQCDAFKSLQYTFIVARNRGYRGLNGHKAAPQNMSVTSERPPVFYNRALSSTTFFNDVCATSWTESIS